MPESLRETLSAVMVETLEKLAFLFATPLGETENVQEAEAGMQMVRVAFNGPFRGEIELGLSMPVVMDLAANMLGADDGSGLSAEERCDALKELANIVCGNLLPAIGGSAAEFTIEAPRVKSLTGWGAHEEGLDNPAAESLLALENGHCRVALRIEDSSPLSAEERCAPRIGHPQRIEP